MQFSINEKYAQDYSGLGSACISTLNMTLFNKHRFYDLANTASPYYQNLRKGAFLHIELQLKDNDALNLPGQKLPLGDFYISNWTSQESDAQVKVQASNLLGFVKDRELHGCLYEKILAAEAFKLFAQSIGLRECFVYGHLHDMVLYNIAIDGKAGEIIHNLCAKTLSMAYVDVSGKALVVKQMQGLCSLARHPLRYFDTNEYRSFKEKFPDRVNTFNCKYHLLEFEQDEEGERLVGDCYSPMIPYIKMYENSFGTEENPVHKWPYEKPFVANRFPWEWRNKPWCRAIGANTVTSWKGEFVVPDRFLRLEFSDDFVYETLEYQWDYVCDEDGNRVTPERVWWKVWLFRYNSDDDQDKILTLYTVVRPKAVEILHHAEQIPERPNDYIIPKESIDLGKTELTNDMIRRRNWQNEPYKFTVSTGQKAQIENIIPQNFYKPGWFEFLFTQTLSGAMVEVWNYSAIEQKFELSVMGRRIVESKQQRQNTITIPHLVVEDGVVEKDVTLPAVSNQAVAKNMLHGLQSYAMSVLGEANVEVWSDPRIALGDRLSFTSVHGYDKKQALVQGITLEYDGNVKQKLTLILVQRVNRDERMYGGYVLQDRPQHTRNIVIYPNDGIY